MDQQIKNAAYTGYVAKGVVYALTGILAFMAAFNLGSSTSETGKLQVIQFLEEQSFGKILLGLLGIGLACYAFWRFIQSIQDPEGIGDDSKGIIKRISFFISGCVYLGLGIYSIVEIFRENSTGSGGGGLPVEGQTAQWLFLAIGIGLAIKSIYQFIKAYKGDFLKKFSISSISDEAKRKTIKNLGYSGLIARGIVVGIIAYFFIKAGSNLAGSSANDVKGTGEAFQFIQQNTSGPWLFGLVAIGLICYGIYMFAMARYRTFDD